MELRSIHCIFKTKQSTANCTQSPPQKSKNQKREGLDLGLGPSFVLFYWINKKRRKGQGLNTCVRPWPIIMSLIWSLLTSPASAVTQQARLCWIFGTCQIVNLSSSLLAITIQTPNHKSRLTRFVGCFISQRSIATYENREIFTPDVRKKKCLTSGQRN